MFFAVHHSEEKFVHLVKRCNLTVAVEISFHYILHFVQFLKILNTCTELEFDRNVLHKITPQKGPVNEKQKCHIRSSTRMSSLRVLVFVYSS